MLGLLLVNLCFSVISLFMNTFLLAQIFVITGESFLALGLFSIVNFSFIFIFHVVGSEFCKRFTPIFVIRLSSALACVILLSVFFLYEQLAYLYVALGLLWGCVTGLYYCAYQFLLSKNSKNEAMLRYISVYISMVSILKLGFPATFGAIIHYGGFLTTSLM